VETAGVEADPKNSESNQKDLKNQSIFIQSIELKDLTNSFLNTNQSLINHKYISSFHKIFALCLHQKSELIDLIYNWTSLSDSKRIEILNLVREQIQDKKIG